MCQQVFDIAFSSQSKHHKEETLVFNISDGIANKHYYCSGRSNAKSSRPIAKQVIAIAKLEWYPKASTVLSRKFPALTKTVYTSQAIGLSLRGLVASTRGRKFPQDLRADALCCYLPYTVGPNQPYWGILPLCCGLIVASSEENPSLLAPL